MLISPALAFQDVAVHLPMGSGATIDGILPLIVILAVFLMSLVFLGRKKGRKRKRRHSFRGSKR